LGVWRAPFVAALAAASLFSSELLVSTEALAGGAQTPAAGAQVPAADPPEGASENAPAGATGSSESEKSQRRGNLVGHGGPVKALATDHARQMVLSGSFDYAMMVWDVSDIDNPKLVHRFDDHDGAVNAAAFVPGSSLVLSAGDDGALSLWNLASGRREHRFEGHTAKVVGIAVSDDGVWAATASWDRTARLWNISQHKPGPVLAGHKGPVNAVAFSSDGAHVFTASYDGTIGMYRTATGEFIRPVYKHGWGINVLQRVPESEQLIFGALNGTAAVVDAARGEKVVELGSSERPVLALAITRQPGLVALGSGDGVVKVFRLGDFQPIEEYQNPYGPAWALAFAPGGASLYLAGLDDFATRWVVTPREPFDPIDSPFPRRFQVTADSDDPVEKGRAHFARKCSVCHTLKPDGRNRAGPALYGLFGRRIATLPGYPYSESLKKLDIVWNEDTVAKLFELGPENFTPGSKMPLQKMTDKSQRDALIAYLKTTPAAEQPDTSPATDDNQGKKP